MGRKEREAIQFSDNPQHTGVTKDTASTPGYFRLLLPGAMFRYIMRSFVESSPQMMADLNDAGFKKISLGHPDRIVNHLRELAQEVSEADLPLTHPEHLEAEEIERQWTAKGEAILETPKGEALLRSMRNDGISTEDIGKTIGKTATGIKAQIPEEYFPRRWKEFSRDVKDKVTRNALSRYYDYSLGAGSLFMTGYYANRVASDMKKVFAETVGYELDKDPKEISYHDMWQSKNKLVEEVCHNFIAKNTGRVATDAVFFAGLLGNIPKLGFLRKYRYISDMGVGLKGAQLIGEVLNKRTTIFEDLVQLIDNKMNPLKGLGSPITSGDIFDLYQKFSLEHDPKATFRDALSSQNRDGRDWNQEQIIFQRITDLMNATYKYKHPGRSASAESSEAADFALPKFLYLLGNGLIDTFKPEVTMAYVEVANRFGIPAVRQLQRSLERGIPVEQALVNFPLEIQQSVKAIRNFAGVKAENVPTPPIASNATPGYRIHGAADVASLDTTLAAQQMGL